VTVRRQLLDVPTLLWVILSLATVLSWQLGVEASSHVLAGAAIIAIAFFKLLLVGIHFMEIGTAPLALRVVFEAYVAVAFGALLAVFLIV
jgi:hypothetical protein